VGRAETPAERILRLARYLKEASGDVNFQRICAELPGYEPERTGLAGRRRKLGRDLKSLEENFGIVVDYDPADDCYRLQPPFLTEDERRALLAAAATVTIDGLDGSPLGELGTTLDDADAQVVVHVHRRVSELSEAMRTRTAVQFRYHGTVRTVEPYATGAWRNRWYLVGYEREAARENKYRLDRIDEAQGAPAVTLIGDADSFELPDGFDPDIALCMDPNVWGQDEPTVATVRVDADHLSAYLYEFDATVVDPDECITEVTVRHRAAFILRLLGFRDHVQLLGSPDLVDELRAWLAPQAEVG
jgi:proteasome accessory factor B